MLVLSRKEGEKLVIDGNIVITINRITGHRVSIGIEAPPDVRVSRGELVRHFALHEPVAAVAV
jgi:carbon storage regulator